jgi:uncharacterized protein
MYISAKTLYDYIQCPHRVWRDLYGPQDEKIIESNPFVELLWQKGIQHEKDVIREIGEYVDLSQGEYEDRFLKTISEMEKGTQLIYQGLLKSKDLLGIPDLLKRLPDGLYIPIDIKSGLGLEGMDEENDEGKIKKHYAVQLCLYVEILKKLGFANENKGIIIDIKCNEFQYPLDSSQSSKNIATWFDEYNKIKEEIRLILENKKQNKPALSGVCRLCLWYFSCKKWCESCDDLTNIFNLGRSKRDTINNDLLIEKIDQIFSCNINEIIERRKTDKFFLRGIGEKTLKQFILRAKVRNIYKKPIMYNKIYFPIVNIELFFDIEDDPTQDFIYLHGVYERKKNGEEIFKSFLARDNTIEEEKEAWKNFWKYIYSLQKGDFAVYYYSSHEKSVYKKLSKKYPDVVSEEAITDFFSNEKVIDLYFTGIIKFTDWPVFSYSLKDLVTYLGFKWRDETPSGALSIQWYNEYLNTKEEKYLNRIIEYNEDDCRALMFLKDYLDKMEVTTLIE